MKASIFNIILRTCLVAILFMGIIKLSNQQNLHEFKETNDNTQYYKERTVGIPSFNYEVFSGHIKIGVRPENPDEEHGSKSNVFYQLFSAEGESIRTPNVNKPVILWLQGGPGCSGWIGNDIEFGPFQVKKNPQNQFYFEYNKNTWAKQGYLLFLDQPYGVAYSIPTGDKNKVPTPDNTGYATRMIESILERFYELYPQLKKNKLFIFGESFAGHYIPSLAAQILKNKNSKIKIDGIGIGDAWVDNLVQGAIFGSYYLQSGIISQETNKKMKQMQAKLLENILTDKLDAASHITDAEEEALVKVTQIAKSLNVKVYSKDMQKQMDLLQEWLTSDEALTQFNIPLNYFKTEKAFEFCNSDIYSAFARDFSTNYVGNFTVILNNIKTLIFQGQDDGAVPTNTAQAFMQDIQWDKIKQFHEATPVPIVFKEHIAGLKYSYDNLIYVIVNRAGHMVPLDQPEYALKMLEQFIKNEL